MNSKLVSKNKTVWQQLEVACVQSNGNRRCLHRANGEEIKERLKFANVCHNAYFTLKTTQFMKETETKCIVCYKKYIFLFL